MKIELEERLDEFGECVGEEGRILVIESGGYIGKLAEKYPYARIYFATSDVYKLREVEEEYGSSIYYVTTDYKTRALPFQKSFFDMIMGDLLLRECFNPQDIASGLGSFIKPTGCLLTSFSNVLYKGALEKLLTEGRSDFIVLRGYSRGDFERLMVVSFYKEVFFYPLYGGEGGEEPPYYIAKSYRSVESTRLLKSCYTPEIRKELAVLLHRIEYDVERDRNLMKLSDFIKRNDIIRDYLEDFVHEACYYRDRAQKILQKIFLDK